MPEAIDFDFKKSVRELIRSELSPPLAAQGFVLSKPTAYIRERDGLLQEFYFKIEASRLRPGSHTGQCLTQGKSLPLGVIIFIPPAGMHIGDMGG